MKLSERIENKIRLLETQLADAKKRHAIAKQKEKGRGSNQVGQKKEKKISK